jgi:hypothetical protein
MLIVENAVISDDVAENFFVCNLEKCKGACCVEGDLGAPLTLDELPELEDALEAVLPYLSEAGRQEIARQGPYILDEDGDFSTPTIGGRECAYALYDGKGVLKCGIEQAYLDGKTPFRKPISCHLYPIRITQYDNYEALNYDRWDICSPACSFGQQLGVPVYQFLKEPLIRKYGEAWYEKLEEEVRLLREKE